MFAVTLYFLVCFSVFLVFVHYHHVVSDTPTESSAVINPDEISLPMSNATVEVHLVGRSLSGSEAPTDFRCTRI